MKYFFEIIDLNDLNDVFVCLRVGSSKSGHVISPWSNGIVLASSATKIFD